MEKFPDHIDAPVMGNGDAHSPVQSQFPSLPDGDQARHLPDRWLPVPRREHNSSGWSPSGSPGVGRHNRQKSLQDAFRTIRTRNGSVSQNAHELADALRAPLSPKLIILCLLWYTSSALTNTSSKSILNAFDKPATLTVVQFAFVSTLCILFAQLAVIFPSLRTKITALRHPIRPPSKDVIMTTLPLAAFQIGGHLLSSTATAKIPVSLVHTIKGLSPLFTVLAYRLIYDIRYPKATYLSLIPLTAGVMLACSGKHGLGGEFLGIIQALLATLIFVTQNIFSKKLFNEAAKAERNGATAQSKKLDKLNLLCYSSGMALLLTLPIWFWSEGITLLRDFLNDGSIALKDGPETMDHGRLLLEFVFNGVTHFGQNILAFVLLSMVSPVTYSVASLIKRVFVIVLAIIWFRSPTTPVQAAGIALTFLGLYLYDRTSESNKADRKVRMMTQTKTPAPLLPIDEGQSGSHNGTPSGVHPYNEGSYFSPISTAAEDTKKTDDLSGTGSRRKRGHSSSQWLAPGTKQEDTWRSPDRTVPT
ncbi:triose-phosphate transporter family-domain-containing protein [Emericellopsis atlantica]|uniref:Triose-phosphate transporter family-domain-containing protein n=1 Tax=Emericellopsis atlantica TaxID=2614577 RepID=A0A9P7ZHV1_9HYPO|nr:triose-phosphate transporter family-domain-containing protein [Emericellopsis atlantica]KAG9251763.1 triose-phosphate transporter family-domain-containing protein [Emericellopsis atlantica]